MHLDDQPVKMSSTLLEKSKMFTDALSSIADPSIAVDFTLDAPKEWLRAWMACYGSEQERLGNADTADLLNCLMVRFFPWIVRSARRVATRDRVLSTSLSSNH
jgi:hypothetical protein